MCVCVCVQMERGRMLKISNTYSGLSPFCAGVDQKHCAAVLDIRERKERKKERKKKRKEREIVVLTGKER